MSALVISFCSA
ncbi:hypothetical protein QLX08_007505 [Tetragonisca angustula]|uniref:Uncharacterized protein n=1 Tax=Tetragonisca angustula TaxID=166442 RepID=A0AAW0ZR61_9HYME